jgi:hypothetical protein
VPKKNWLTPKHRALVNTLEKVVPAEFSIREFVSVYVLGSQPNFLLFNARIENTPLATPRLGHGE